jgi:hypothetical protein
VFFSTGFSVFSAVFGGINFVFGFLLFLLATLNKHRSPVKRPCINTGLRSVRRRLAARVSLIIFVYAVTLSRAQGQRLSSSYGFVGNIIHYNLLIISLLGDSRRI